ncbi:DMT family transporter [Streptococcus uberis]|uniref:DMT family transporter n=1 Tax=Streptococcus uberis TaxID=1349 RepID=UPI001939C714|nr:DMT family transporter [Streptococcus uberis]MCK1201815.1 DMT family transporter [Streptococcus uberis]
MVLVAGTAWGLSGVSGQYLMTHGVNLNLLTSLRLIIAGSILGLFTLIKQREKILTLLSDKKGVKQLIFFSLAGLLMNQFTYMNAIKYTNAGTATVLQYMSPVLILVAVSVVEKRLPSVAEALSIILAVLGTVIIATHGHLGSLAITPKGLFWGVLSAISAALYVLLPGPIVDKWGSMPVISLAMLFSGILFTLFTQPWQYDLPLTTGNGIALVGLVLVGTIIAYTLFVEGASIVGPVNGSLIAAVEPIASVFFSIILLSETFYSMDILGMLLIMVAVLLISLRDFVFLKKQEHLKEMG